MKKFVCSICGGSRIERQDDGFVCSECGCRYTLEEARELFEDVDELSLQNQESEQSQALQTTEGDEMFGKIGTNSSQQTGSFKKQDAHQQLVTPSIGGQAKTYDNMTDMEKLAIAKKTDKKRGLPFCLMAIIVSVVGLVSFIMGFSRNSTRLTVFGILGLLIGWAILGVFYFVIMRLKKGNYIETHCPYCGATYEGCDYGYNETGRRVTGHANYNEVSSSFTYEIACRECGKVKHGKISFSKGSADRNVDKLTRQLDKIVGPEVTFDEKVAKVSKKEAILNWAVSMGYCLLMIILCIVFATTAQTNTVINNKADTKDYYGRYVYGGTVVEFKSDGTVMLTNLGSIEDGKYDYKYYTEDEVRKKFSGNPFLPALVIHKGFDSYLVFSLKKDDDGNHYTLIHAGISLRLESVVESSVDPQDYYGKYVYSNYYSNSYIEVTRSGNIIYTSSTDRETLQYKYYTAVDASAKTGTSFASPVLLCFQEGDENSYLAFILSEDYYGEYKIIFNNKTYLQE